MNNLFPCATATKTRKPPHARALPRTSAPARRNSREKRAFTLLEILTATAIMAVIILLLLQLAMSAFGLYDNAVATLRTLNSSRIALNALRQDLQSAIMPNDGSIWFQISHKRSNTEEDGNLPNSSLPQIMLFSATPDRIKREKNSGGGASEFIPGDICAVKYDLRQRSIFEGKNTDAKERLTYNLYRAVLDSKATFDSAIPSITGNIKNKSALSDNERRCPSLFWAGKLERPNLLGIENERDSSSVETWMPTAQNYLLNDILGINFVFYCKEINTSGGAQAPKYYIYAHNSIAQNITTLYTALGNGAPGKREGSTGYASNIKSFPDGAMDAFICNGRLYFGDPESSDGWKSDNSSIVRTLEAIEIVVTCVGPAGARELAGLQAAAADGKISEERFKEFYSKYGEAYTLKVGMQK